MTDTPHGTSDAPACTDCGATFGDDDDKRYKKCRNCRLGEPDNIQPPKPNEPERAPMPEDEVEAIVLDYEAEDLPKPLDRDYYWCGATPDAPHHFYTLGGIEFPKFVGEVRDRKFVDNTADGKIHYLPKEVVDLVKLHAASQVIRRWRIDEIQTLDGGRRVYQGDLISTMGAKTRRYTPQEGDWPVGCFLYMVRVRHRTDRPSFGDQPHPPTLISRPPNMAPKVPETLKS